MKEFVRSAVIGGSMIVGTAWIYVIANLFAQVAIDWFGEGGMLTISTLIVTVIAAYIGYIISVYFIKSIKF